MTQTSPAVAAALGWALAVLLLVAPGSRAQAPRPGETSVLGGSGDRYRGEPISISVQNADLQDVLRLIVRSAGINLVVDDDLKGKKVTMELDEVPWDQALEILLGAHSLGADWSRNVLHVAPVATLVRAHQQSAQLRELREQSGGLVAIAHTLSYADAAEVEPLVRAQLSPEGRLTIDRRTNTLIVQDRPAVIRRLAGLLASADGGTPGSGGAVHASASQAGRRASAPRGGSDERVLASWNGWVLECRESFTRRLGVGDQVLRPVSGTQATLGRAELDREGLELAKLQLGRLTEQGLMRMVSAHPVALPPGGGETIALGRLGESGGEALLDLALERNGGRFVLTFRARRASGQRLPFAWHGPTTSGWVVELQPAPGEPWRVLLLAPAPENG